MIWTLKQWHKLKQSKQPHFNLRRPTSHEIYLIQLLPDLTQFISIILLRRLRLQIIISSKGITITHSNLLLILCIKSMLMLLHSIRTRTKDHEIIFLQDGEITLYWDYMLVFRVANGRFVSDAYLTVKFSQLYFSFVYILNVMLGYFRLPHIRSQFALLILIPWNLNTAFHFLEAQLIIVF